MAEHFNLEAELRRDRPRVKTTSDAAKWIGVARTRLQEISKTSPWWRAEFHDPVKGGFDVVGIVVAKMAHYLIESHQRSAGAYSTEEEEQIAKANLAVALEEANIKRLERQKRERVELEASNQLVAAEIVTSLMTEMLGEERRALDDIPFVLSKQVPPQLLQYVYVDESRHGGDPSQMAPLQRIIMERIEQFQMWLDMISTDIFEDESVDEALAES